MRRKYALVLLFLLGVVGLIAGRAQLARVRQGKTAVAGMVAPVPQPGVTGKQLPGGPYEPSDPRWAEVRAKDVTDKQWEWRMPINFYGKVVDEGDQPVSGANIKFSWTDWSTKRGEKKLAKDAS